MLHCKVLSICRLGDVWSSAHQRPACASEWHVLDVYQMKITF